MECEAEWVVLVQELEWGGSVVVGKDILNIFRETLCFVCCPGPVAKYWSQCVYVSVRGVSLKLSSRTTVFYATFFLLLVYLLSCVITVHYYY